MARLRVILVEPKYEGNVGAVARLCRNFEAEELVLVSPPSFGDEAKERAMHAWDFLANARKVDEWSMALEGVDFLVGTTAKIPRSDKAHLRNPVEAHDLVRRVKDTDGCLGLAFGREDFGLLTHELEDCDMTVTIPTSADYRSLNLSHAVCVVLYEFWRAKHPEPTKAVRRMDGRMRDTLYDTLDLFIESLGMADHKVTISKRVMRKLLGRAVPSSWEFYVVMGLLRRGLRNMGVDITNHEETEFDLPEGLEDEFGELLVDR
jgi:TrmH family RNA methyltransferase